jgi:prepilin-type N-terminal cleavage/methylation domain-containing protein
MRARKTDLDSEQSGFTLIELLIVIALIAILTTLVLPNVAHWRHKAAVTAAQGTAHCLENGLALFNPQSTDTVERYPIGIVDQTSLVTAGGQLGCKMPPVGARQALNWANCEMIIVCPDGSVVTQTCSVDPNVACGGGAPTKIDYRMTFGVPAYTDTINISSNYAMQTLISPLP